MKNYYSHLSKYTFNIKLKWTDYYKNKSIKKYYST